MIMRYKQRPIKTSRHKSVTFLNDTPQTSFGDSSGRQNHHHYHHHASHKDIVGSSSAISSSNHNIIKSFGLHQQQQQQQQQQSPAKRNAVNTTTASYLDLTPEFFKDIDDRDELGDVDDDGNEDEDLVSASYDDDNRHQMDNEQEEDYMNGQNINGTNTTSTSGTYHDDADDDDGDVLSLNLHIKIKNNYNYNHAHQSTYDLKGSGTNSALNLKQYQHVRHMSDVMRLAFLENNDISPEVWGNIDFNSSTASILQRNIQKQLNWNEAHASTPKRELRVRRNVPTKAAVQQQQQHNNNSNNQHQQQHHHHLRNNNNHSHQNHEKQQHRHLQLHHQHDQEMEQDQDEEEEEEEEEQEEEQEQRQLSINHQAATPQSVSNKKSNVASLQQQQQNQRPQRRTQISANNQSATAASATTLSATSIKQKQPGSGDFPCDEPGCGKCFPSLRKLRHHKVVHSNDFPYTCQFKGCDKRFKRKFGIDLHSTTHFDLDPDMYNRTSNNSSMQIFGRRMQYSVCKQCDAKFKTVHEYQVHMLAHGKEPFKCPVKGCGQSFSIWKSFQKHRASHYFNYYCRMDSQCDHHTSNLQLLKLHIYCCHFNRKLPENAKPTSRDNE